MITDGLQLSPWHTARDQLASDHHCLHSMGYFSDNLLKRYGISEKPQRERVSQGSQITELEQKKPRRKDTPAIHIPPLIIGKKLNRPEGGVREDKISLDYLI
uniref:Protein phosphatase 1 regulatory subunit 17 n=1 Tax=Phasianus colchicus TaxID=9054 RepID=A0A669QXG2_PHACC